MGLGNLEANLAALSRAQATPDAMIFPLQRIGQAFIAHWADLAGSLSKILQVEVSRVVDVVTLRQIHARNLKRRLVNRVLELEPVSVLADAVEIQEVPFSIMSDASNTMNPNRTNRPEWQNPQSRSFRGFTATRKKGVTL
jgi:hypothetical protein